MIPAPVSVSTKLQLLNRVLLESGERRVDTSADNTAVIKLATLLQSCLDFVNDELPWAELTAYLDTQGATAYTDPLVMGGASGYRLPSASYNKALDVYDVTTGCYVPYVIPTDMQSYSEMPPKWTTFMGCVFIRPSTRCLIYYTNKPTVPILDGDTFAAPEYLVDLYAKRALALYASRHLGDYDLAEAVKLEYYEEIMRHASVYSRVPTSARNTNPGSDYKGVTVQTDE